MSLIFFPPCHDDGDDAFTLRRVILDDATAEIGLWGLQYHPDRADNRALSRTGMT